MPWSRVARAPAQTMSENNRLPRTPSQRAEHVSSEGRQHFVGLELRVVLSQPLHRFEIGASPGLTLRRLVIWGLRDAGKMAPHLLQSIALSHLVFPVLAYEKGCVLDLVLSRPPLTQHLSHRVVGDELVEVDPLA